jgi:hypothetical protein
MVKKNRKEKSASEKPNMVSECSADEEVISELHYVLKDRAMEYSPSRLAELTGVAFERTFSRSRREDKMANALARGLTVRQKMAEEEGGSMSADETARYLGITKQSVFNLYHAGKLLGWRTQKQAAVRFPVWQFVEKERLPGLEKALAKLGESGLLDDWGKTGFFLETQAMLDNRRALDLLREGKIERVVEAAENFV